MLYENYLPAAFGHTPSKEDPRRGAAELVLYNPTPDPCQATMTVYYTDRPPRTLPPIAVRPETNELVVMPGLAPDAFTDCGFWGARIVSTTPLMLNLIDGVRIVVEKPRFRGGCTNFHGTKLHKEWHIPDCLWLEWNLALKGDLARAPWPFNELEHLHILNPNPRPAEVDIAFRYRKLEHTTMHVTIPAERVWQWENKDKVPFNQSYSLKIVSSEPVSAAEVRYIYGLRGLDEWGMTVHCAMYGVPGPFPEA